MNRLTYIDNISSILNQPPFNSPATMAIFATASRAARISAAVYPTRAQLEAITHMQEQLAPILRVQNQLESISAPEDALAMWADMLRIANDPVKRALDTIKAVSDVQRHSIVKAACSPQMAAAIQPALWYLEQEHPDVYREIVPDVKPQSVPIPGTCPRKKAHIRRHTLDKATRMAGRTGYIIKSIDSKIQSMPSGKLSNLISLILNIGNIAPSEYAQSISLLCFAIAVFLTFYHKE